MTEIKTPERIAHELVEQSFHEFEDHTRHVERLIERGIEADRAQLEERLADARQEGYNDGYESADRFGDA